VKEGVGAAAAGVTALVTLIPGVGPILAVGVGPGLAAATPLLAQELNRVFDFGDDKIGTALLTLSAKSMVLLAARTPNSSFLGIGFKAETALISGQGASYKAYFGVDPA